MKEYILKIVKYSLPLIILFYLKPIYLLLNNKYEKSVAGSEVYVSIKNSKQKSLKTKLILGDSGGYQLFPNTDDHGSVLSLACNQAIGMVGHYLLLVNFLNSCNEIDTLFLIFGPEGFNNNLDQVYSFHYFLKPFYKEEYKPYFSLQVYEQIKKIPFWYLCKEPYILTSNWAPNFNTGNNSNFIFLSPITEEYLKKIFLLGEENNIKIIIIAAPMNIERKNQLDSIYLEEVLHSDLNEVLNTYFESILWLPDTCFLKDGVHLKNPADYSDYYRNKWIK